MTTAQDTAAQTLSMLEERLQHLSFVVNGDAWSRGFPETAEAATAAAAAGSRLRALQRKLNTLAARSFPVSDVLQLQKTQPELFDPTGSRTVPNTLPAAALVQLILAHEELFRSMASQLSALNDAKDIPDSAPMSKLLGMEARVKQLQAKQNEQAVEFAELRTRSAKLVERWYENGVLDMGERWAEWEERLRDCEILVRRKEAEKKREEGAV